MKIPRDWNGIDLSKKLAMFAFVVVRQSGSHLLLRHGPTGEVISIPAHKPLKTGTLAGVLRDVAELTGISKQDLLRQLGE